MDLDSLAPRYVAIVGAVALLPAAWYVLGRPSTVAAVAAVNVVLIVAALWAAMGPHDVRSDDAAH
ncbi:cytochrome-ba3 oxidase subunit [Halovivax limisalsi]|uniref:cytochrome-ba3 oxidase subunit n=1 Tax=Halovivax limisalsi TaxID=1453760 RepID=UPI001FFC8144|nr:cytochrome-ba3 oxidase subunit [Halovivax limisalsi]